MSETPGSTILARLWQRSGVELPAALAELATAVVQRRLS